MTKINKMPTIYIGYDPREEDYYHVLKRSIESHTRDDYNIVPLVQKELRRAGLYHRAPEFLDGGKVDVFDGKPFSTEFSFSRFLVPMLNQYSGLALFMDCDMLVRADITEVFDKWGTGEYPVACVQHMYEPEEKVKMDKQIQTRYRRKNWSSFVLWDCGHKEIKNNLTVSDVNTKTGSWLHAFEFIDYAPIGAIHPEWNWLDGHSLETLDAKNVHFTTGGPLFDGWTGKRTIDNFYATEWDSLRDKMKRDGDI